MVSNVLNTGDKIDIRILKKNGDSADEQPAKLYKSVIYNMMKNGNLEIAMPMEGSKMVVLSLGMRYEMLFYTKTGLYKCIAQVKQRYKSENLYMLLMELKSQLSKFQRREYFRYPCTMDIEFMWILEDEAKNIHSDDIFAAYEKKDEVLLLLPGLAVDLSGGGIRFISEEQGKKNDYLLIKLKLQSDSISKEVLLSGKLLQCTPLDNDSTKYEHRVQFLLTDATVRELIIKYIFDEERKNRKNKGY